MLLEQFDFGVEVRVLHLFLGLGLGLVFGIAAQISRFCLRRAVSGPASERHSAAGVWLAGLAAAIVGTQGAIALGYADVSEHRFLSAELPVAALVLGGLAFGIGMVLTRGCVSRLTVLSGTGNLRAITVLAIFAIVAHSALKGVLAPVRTALGSLTVDSPVATLAALPGGGVTWGALAAVGLGAVAWRSGARARDLGLGAVIGLLVAIGWAATSVLLMDEFDPQPVQTLAFTLPWSETLFWTIASTAIPAGFGVGFVGGVLAGSFLSGAARGELKLESFESPAQTLRYASGAALMGLGGVLAGGCTVGAGLAGSSTLSVAAIIALASIVAGGKLAALTFDGQRTGLAVPAE